MTILTNMKRSRNLLKIKIIRYKICLLKFLQRENQIPLKKRNFDSLSLKYKKKHNQKDYFIQIYMSSLIKTTRR